MSRHWDCSEKQSSIVLNDHRSLTIVSDMLMKLNWPSLHKREWPSSLRLCSTKSHAKYQLWDKPCVRVSVLGLGCLCVHVREKEKEELLWAFNFLYFFLIYFLWFYCVYSCIISSPLFVLCVFSLMYLISFIVDLSLVLFSPARSAIQRDNIRSRDERAGRLVSLSGQVWGSIGSWRDQKPWENRTGNPTRAQALGTSSLPFPKPLSDCRNELC